MNLIQGSWLPFRMLDGSEQVLPMNAICDQNIVDFALPRADFQGAAYQFSIGLLQTVFAPEDKYQWHDLYEQAPEVDELQQAFNKAAHAFNATGGGPLFMQDFDVLESVKSTTVAGLLMEAPGANGLKLNTDHFIKRDIGKVMSLEMALIALFTLQANAPSGGVGHRTGLRGGGPLTTLVLPQHKDATLWQKIWLNVINKDHWRYDEPDLHSDAVFPWLAKTKTSEKKGAEIYASDVHPLHMFWAMPRRIRLEIEEGESVCQISGKAATQTVSFYRAQNYGGNYSGTWAHPLTPYKWNPKKPEEEHLSAKGQPGGVTYKIWDSLTFTSDSGGQHSAQVVKHFYSLSEGLVDAQSAVPCLWVFGYDMDNMKARGWYSVTLPLFAVSAKQQEGVVCQVKELQTLALNSLWQCRTQIKTAWFDKPGDAKGDMSFIDLAFWQRTEPAFYIAVHQVVQAVGQDDSYLTAQQADTWLKALRNNVMDLFDEFALSELGSERSMAKRIKARQALTGWLYGGKGIKKFISDYKVEKLKEAV